MMKLCIFVLILSAVLGASPPIFDYAFDVTFNEQVTSNKTVYKTVGQTFYDPKNNRERVDRLNGQHDIFCSTVLPNITTSCQHITTGGNRWLVFPQRSQCCFCCDSAHGCGILKSDWLADAEYKGQEMIDNIPYDKWSKDGMVGYNYLWVSVDKQVPRRLDENGHITDYNIATFHNQTTPFPDSTFALPAYCNVKTPVNCPLESFCGKHRSVNLFREE